MVLVQVPTPTQALLIDCSETLMLLVAMLYFRGQHQPPSSDPQSMTSIGNRETTQFGTHSMHEFSVSLVDASFDLPE